MNKKLIKMPSIDQFRNVVSNINRAFNFIGLDDNGDGIYDVTLKKPVITFKGRTKCHGTNGGVSFNAKNGIWAQSKNDIITPQKDNAGFAFFVESKERFFDDLFRQIIIKNSLELNDNTITIYGEWCGANIQKTVALVNLPKSFFIFGVKITPHTENDEELKDKPAYWVDHFYLNHKDENIFNIDDFGVKSIEIDFNMPQLVQNELSEITLGVEKECPVALAFGHSGIGEGVVWSAEYKGVVHRFKVKGDKHSSSKVKVLASVDVEKLNSIIEFVDYATTESRFNQALENVFINDEPIDIKKMGDVIRWVINDIIKEEMDTMVSNGVEPKEVNKYISTRVREMFMKKQEL